MSKKISVERRQDFLHKISARVDEEKKTKEAKKMQKDKTSLLGKTAGKKAKGGRMSRKTSAPQVLI